MAATVRGCQPRAGRGGPRWWTCAWKVRRSSAARRSSRRRRWSSWPTCRRGSVPAATSSSPPGRTRRAEIAAARRIDFREDTAHVRSDGWHVPPPPPGLVDRRVEITGPTEPKMAINALNCGANVWLADLEDANTPHWRNVVGGQVGALRRRPADAGVHQSRRQGVPAAGRRRAADDRAPPARLAPARAAPARRRRAGGRRTRRRGPVPVPQRGRADPARQRARTSTCRRWRATSRRGCGPRCSTAPRRSSACAGTVRATMLIETIPAAFEMEEMLYELGPTPPG